ncbi:ATP-binding protein [Nisaea nitritireducens]|uniref:ATP-binding protein n=1 Tax=Nisaea nitritireducens TaxID=568392 RepID=UPI001865E386|nr:ATP-binding protein [Nisaea nitritireducens]
MTASLRKSILALIVLAFAVSLGFGFKHVTTVDETLESRLAENAVWAGAQLQFELGRFRESLYDLANNDRNASPKETSKRFDILWSRVQIFREGDLAELVTVSGMKPIVDNIQSQIEEIDSIIADDGFKTRAQPETIRRILDTGQSINRLSQELTAGIMHGEHVRFVNYIRERQSAIHDVMISLVGLFLCGAAFTVSLVFSNRQANKATLAATSAEEAAVAARERVTDAIESMAEGFAVIDSVGRYVSANTIFRSFMNRFSGSAPTGDFFETTLETGFRDHVLLDPLGRPVNRIMDGLRCADGTGFEFVMDDENWVRIETRRTANGTMIVKLADVTDRKRWEIETENAKNTAIRNLEAQSRFLSMMSHEVRTPLNGVLGILQIIIDEPLSQAARHYVKTALNSAISLRTVIDDVLDASKIEANEMALRNEALSLANLSENVLDLMTPLAHKSGLSLTLTLDPNLPKSVTGDADRLRQILNNFVSNAIKFTEHGNVALSLDRLSKSDGRCLVRFSVTDTGIGIPAEKQADLFRAFKQIDSSYSRRFGGTGLGLAISKVLAEKMGGVVGFESTAGKGSRFWFDIPFEILSSEPWVKQAGPSGSRVLIDLSDRALADALSAQIKGFGMNVAVCDTSCPQSNGETDVILINDSPLDASTAIRPHMHLQVLHAENMLDDVTEAFDSRTRFLRYPIHPTTLMRELLAPRPPVPVKIEPARPIEESGSGPLRILLAEDCKTNQLVMQAFLKGITTDLVIAENGKLALEEARTNTFDLILMDVSMPEMDGIEATKKIREFSDIPVIGVTAHAFESALTSCLDAGMDRVLTKPLAKQDLYSTIKELLDESDRAAALAVTGTESC